MWVPRARPRRARPPRQPRQGRTQGPSRTCSGWGHTGHTGRARHPDAAEPRHTTICWAVHGRGARKAAPPTRAPVYEPRPSHALGTALARWGGRPGHVARVGGRGAPSSSTCAPTRTHRSRSSGYVRPPDISRSTLLAFSVRACIHVCARVFGRPQEWAGPVRWRLASSVSGASTRQHSTPCRGGTTSGPTTAAARAAQSSSTKQRPEAAMGWRRVTGDLDTHVQFRAKDHPRFS